MPTNIEKIKQDIAALDEEIESLSARIRKYPSEDMFCENNGKYIKCYIKKDGRKIYLAKRDRETICMLAQKKYYSNKLVDALAERKLLSKCVNEYNKNINHVNYMFERHPQLYDLMSGIDRHNDWDCEEYERCEKNPEQLIVKTISGNIVRSKSEAIIDSVLFDKNIPFRYEAVLELGGIILYPDFTIKHPYTGEIIYWEHFGMMDNQTYSRNTANKLSTYISNGIIPSINLITTYETSKEPLNFNTVKKLVEMHFNM